MIFYIILVLKFFLFLKPFKPVKWSANSKTISRVFKAKSSRSKTGITGHRMCARQPIEIRATIDLHRLIQIQALFNFWVWVQQIFRMSEVFSAETIASLIMNQRYVHNFYYETPVT